MRRSSNAAGTLRTAHPALHRRFGGRRRDGTLFALFS
jgi:hypothetical protein